MEGDSDGKKMPKETGSDHGADLSRSRESSVGSSNNSLNSGVGSSSRREMRTNERGADRERERGGGELDLKAALAEAKLGDKVDKNQLNKNLLNVLKQQVQVTETFSTAMKDKLVRKDSKINEMEAEMEELRHKLRRLEKSGVGAGGNSSSTGGSGGSSSSSHHHHNGSSSSSNSRNDADDRKRDRKKAELEEELSRTRRKLERERSRSMQQHNLSGGRLESIAEFEQEENGWCRRLFLWPFLLLLTGVLLAVFAPAFTKLLTQEAVQLLKHVTPSSVSSGLSSAGDTQTTGIFLTQAQTRIESLETQLSLTRKAEKDCLESLRYINDTWKFANESLLTCNSRSAQTKFLACQSELDQIMKLQAHSGDNTNSSDNNASNVQAELFVCRSELQTCSDKLIESNNSNSSNSNSGNDEAELMRSRILQGAQRSNEELKKQLAEHDKELKTLRNAAQELNQSLLSCQQGNGSTSSFPFQQNETNKGVCLNDSHSSNSEGKEATNAAVQKMKDSLTLLESKLKDVVAFDTGVIDGLMNQITKHKSEMENAQMDAQRNHSNFTACEVRVKSLEDRLDLNGERLVVADKTILNLQQKVDKGSENLERCQRSVEKVQETLDNQVTRNRKEISDTKAELQVKENELEKAKQDFQSSQNAQKVLDIVLLDIGHELENVRSELSNVSLRAQDLARKQKICTDEIIKGQNAIKNLEVSKNQQLNHVNEELELWKKKKHEPRNDSSACAARIDSIKRVTQQIISQESSTRQTYLEELQNKTNELNKYREEANLQLEKEKQSASALSSSIAKCENDKLYLKQQQQTTSQKDSSAVHEKLSAALSACEEDSKVLLSERDRASLLLTTCEKDKQDLGEVSETATTLKLSLSACENDKKHMQDSKHVHTLQSALEECQREMENTNEKEETNSQLENLLKKCENENENLLKMNSGHVSASGKVLCHEEEVEAELNVCVNRQRQIERETQVLSEQKHVLEKRNELLERENNGLIDQNVALNESLTFFAATQNKSETNLMHEITRVNLDSETKKNAGALLAVWLALAERQDRRHADFEHELSNTNNDQIRSLLNLKNDVNTLLKNELVDESILQIGQQVVNVLPELAGKCDHKHELIGSKSDMRKLLEGDVRDLFSNVSLPSYETVKGLRSLAQDFSIQEWDIVTKACWLFMVVSLDVSLFQAFLPSSRFGIFIVFLLWATLTLYCFVLRRKICMALFACNALLAVAFLIRPKQLGRK